MDTDILVIGAGGAGLCASVAAAEKGSSVILIEKNKSTGGNSAMAGGILAVESHIQKKNNINFTREEIFKNAMDYTHWKINPDLFRTYIDKSADTVKWLENKGLNFSLMIEDPNSSKYSTWHGIENGGFALIKALEKILIDMGGKILKQTITKKILLDKTGKTTGAIVLRDGEEIVINAKAIIIATGGYGGNKEMLKKYYPAYSKDMRLMGSPSMGEGLLLAFDAGADSEGLGNLHLHGPCFRSSRHIDALARQPQTLWVNKKGKRFCDESLTFFWPECSNILERQPGNMCYSLLDTSILEHIRDNGITAMVLHVDPQTKLSGIEEKLSKYMEKDKVMISGNWEKIAEWIGAETDCLRESVENYNNACEESIDSQYYKKPEYLMPFVKSPYYAIRSYASFLGTLGGIKINYKMETIGKDGDPIPGLYTSGQDAGGWQSSTYNLNTPGATFGFAVNSGRIAGENANEYLTNLQSSQ